MRSALAVLLSCCVLCVAFVASLPAQEWARFRGPNGSGESEAKTIPGTWSEADYNWKVKLPGIGHSSPAIWGEKIFVLSANPEDATRFVLCLSAADGRTLWTKSFPSKTHHLHERSSYASCSPAVDAEFVYVAWSDPEHTWLKALRHDGSEVWTADFGPWVSQHGFGSSPVLFEDLVVVNWSQEPSKRLDSPDPHDSFIVAVDRKTGQQRWKTPRVTDTTSYSVPCVRQPKDGPVELVCCSTAEGMFGLDPKTGAENWSLPVFKMRTVSSPVLIGDLIFGSTGSGGGGNYVVAVKPGKNAEVAFEVKTQAPYVPTVVARGDLAFLWFDGGIVTCINATDGTVHWRERVGGNYSGSPIRVADKIYCISEGGEVVVLAATKDYKLIGRHALGEPSRSTPAVSGGRMYLRTYSHLISLGGKAS